MTWGELRRRVAELATALKERGVEKGDRVVMVGAHSATTLIVFLATTWLGGLFSSSSTDMGVGGLLQRTVQIDPKVSEIVVWIKCGDTDKCSLSSLTMALYIMARSLISATRSKVSWKDCKNAHPLKRLSSFSDSRRPILRATSPTPSDSKTLSSQRDLSSPLPWFELASKTP